MVSFGNATGPVAPFDCALLARSGSVYVTRPGLLDYIATREELVQRCAELFEVVGAGKVRIAINQRYALKDAAQAHSDLEGRRTTGSTILLP
ncbi:MAG: zinc-binding dehydrogenase, partial [Thauera propionica]|jgi:NADPH2:quinone reductase|nr:zinc-binding dehydrogenase [Thauera propionica]